MNIQVCRFAVDPVRFTPNTRDANMTERRVHRQPGLWPEIAWVFRKTPRFSASSAEAVHKNVVDQRLGRGEKHVHSKWPVAVVG